MPGARSGCFPGDTSAGLNGSMKVVRSSIGIERLVFSVSWIVDVACGRDILTRGLNGARVILKCKQ